MRPRITAVEALEKYKVDVTFDDGVKGILDLSGCAGKGVFQSWEEDDNFFKVFINPQGGAITWPNEIDIDTYNAYCIIKGISPEQFFRKQSSHATHL